MQCCQCSVGLPYLISISDAQDIISLDLVAETFSQGIFLWLGLIYFMMFQSCIENRPSRLSSAKNICDLKLCKCSLQQNRDGNFGNFVPSGKQIFRVKISLFSNNYEFGHNLFKFSKNVLKFQKKNRSEYPKFQTPPKSSCFPKFSTLTLKKYISEIGLSEVATFKSLAVRLWLTLQALSDHSFKRENENLHQSNRLLARKQHSPFHASGYHLSPPTCEIIGILA